MRSGFTILEIIIVVVIIGILTSLAIPRMNTLIERSRATEAILLLQEARLAMERCYILRNLDYTACRPESYMSFSAPNSHFNYMGTIHGASAGLPLYQITLQRNTYELSVDVIVGGSFNNMMATMSSTGTFSINGSGIYNGIDTTPR